MIEIEYIKVGRDFKIGDSVGCFAVSMDFKTSIGRICDFDDLDSPYPTAIISISNGNIIKLSTLYLHVIESEWKENINCFFS